MKRRSFIKGILSTPALAVPSVVVADKVKGLRVRPSKGDVDMMMRAALQPPRFTEVNGHMDYAWRLAWEAREPLDITDPEYGKSKVPIFRESEWYMIEQTTPKGLVARYANYVRQASLYEEEGPPPGL